MIKNAKNTFLNASSGTVPDMSSTIVGWFQKMTFTRVVKTVVNFENVETTEDFSALGVMQPTNPQTLRLKPEGQTAWDWNTIHSDKSLVLNMDEIVTYLGKEYRVMSKTDYSIYGYVQYDVVSTDSMV